MFHLYRFQPKNLGKVIHRRRFHCLHPGIAPHQSLDGDYLAINQSARMDQRPVLEVRAHVERESMVADPPPNRYPDRANFLISDPDSCIPRHAAAFHAKTGQQLNHRLFKIPEEKVDILPVGSKIEDRVSDQLARPMVSDIPASVCVNQFDSRLLHFLRLHEEGILPAGSPKGDDRVVLKEEEGVRNLPGKALIYQLSLEREALLITDQAEVVNPQIPMRHA